MAVLRLRAGFVIADKDRTMRRDPKRNTVKPEMHRLETRWLMSQGDTLGDSRRIRDLLTDEIDRVGGWLGHSLATEFVAWAAHRADQEPSGVAALETFKALELKQGRLEVTLRGQEAKSGDHARGAGTKKRNRFLSPLIPLTPLIPPLTTLIPP
jgi:hypothetical protein